MAVSISPHHSADIQCSVFRYDLNIRFRFGSGVPVVALFSTCHPFPFSIFVKCV